MIKTNYSDLPEDNNSIIPEGDYEVVIKEVKEGTSTNKGTPYVQFELVIRNDINQQYKNKHLWYVVYDTPTTRERGIFPGNIYKVLKHAGIPDKSEFKDYQDVTRAIFGRPIIATVKHSEYNGQTQEKVNFIGPTKFPQCHHQWQAPNQGNNQGSSSSYGQSNQTYNNGGNQQASQGNNQNYNNGQQGNYSNQGNGNQNGGSTNQGNGWYNNGQNVAGTGQAWQGNQNNNPGYSQPVNDDDLPF